MNDTPEAGHPFHIVDVFAEEKYAGNQLAVVRDAGDLSEAEMAAIAREMNYSETTFVESEDQRAGGYDVRIFTPAGEIPFAGHPTLGTAQVLREVAADGADEIMLDLGVGQIPVTVHRDDGTAVLWMEQVEPEFGETLPDPLAAEVIGFEPGDLADDYPAWVVYHGAEVVRVQCGSAQQDTPFDQSRLGRYPVPGCTAAVRVQCGSAQQNAPFGQVTLACYPVHTLGGAGSVWPGAAGRSVRRDDAVSLPRPCVVRSRCGSQWLG